MRENIGKKETWKDEAAACRADSREIPAPGCGRSAVWIPERHPAADFVWFAAVLAATICQMAPGFLALSYAAGAIALGISSGVSGVRRVVRRTVWAVGILLAANVLFRRRGATELFALGPVFCSKEIVLFSVSAGILLASVLTWCELFGRTLDADRLVELFGGAAPRLGLFLSMTFRFIPLLRRRFREIRDGQIALGRGAAGRSSFGKLRDLAKSLEILLAWSLSSSLETADAMAGRGYGLSGRTRYSLIRFRRRDGAWMAAALACATVIVTAAVRGDLHTVFYPHYAAPDPGAGSLAAFAAFLILLLAPAADKIVWTVRGRRAERRPGREEGARAC